MAIETGAGAVGAAKFGGMFLASAVGGASMWKELCTWLLVPLFHFTSDTTFPIGTVTINRQTYGGYVRGWYAGTNYSTVQRFYRGSGTLAKQIELNYAGSMWFGSFNDAGAFLGGSIIIQNDGSVKLGLANAKLSFYGAAEVAKPTITGSRADGSALAGLLTKLASLGLVTDSTTM